MNDHELRRGAVFLGQYRIDALLGRGGMGEVWRAWDLRLKRPVALKVMLRELTEEPGYVERFERETQVVAQFKHGNIGRIYAAGPIPDRQPLQLYMAMEMIEGMSLRLILVTVKRLDETSALYYAVQVLEALEEAHAKKIIHRDVKPENVIIGKDGHATVIDFGIAKGHGTTRDADGATRRGADRITHRIGTPRYMSPEQVRGGEITAASDLYAVGVLLYQMLSGDFPYPGIEDDNETAILMAHLELAPHPLPMVVPDCTSELWAIVLRLLAKDPADRYGSAEEAAAALSAYMRGSIDPLHPLAKKMAHDRRTIAHKAVYEHRQSKRPEALEESVEPVARPMPRQLVTTLMPAVPGRMEAAVPSRQAIPPPATVERRTVKAASPWQARSGPSHVSKTGPLPVKAVDRSPAAAASPPPARSSASGRSWAKERPAALPRRLSLVTRDVLGAVALGSMLGLLAWSGVRLGGRMRRAPSAVATTAGSVAPPAVTAPTASVPTAPVAPAAVTVAAAVTPTATVAVAPPVVVTKPAEAPKQGGGTSVARVPALTTAVPVARALPAGKHLDPDPLASVAPVATAAPTPIPTVSPSSHRVFGLED